jgi:Restriction endonuclease
MPARSNEFQRLTFLVKKVLADSAIVTESKSLVDRRTGTAREVDVCIESTVGGHAVVVAVECRDHGRPADVSWVEQMKAKHEHLATNALVLVSRSGYTEEAATVAKAEGIQLLSYDTLSEEHVRNLFGFGSSLWGAIYELSVTNVVADVPSIGEIPADRVSLLPGNLIFSPAGTQIGTAHQLVNAMLRGEHIAELLVKNGANESHSHFVLEWDAPTLASGARIFLEKLVPRTFVPVKRLHVTGTCRFSVCEFRLRHGAFGSVQVAWGTGELEGKSAMVVAIGAAASPAQLTLDLRATKPPERT